MLQPPNNLPQIGFILFCHLDILASGAMPCSQNNILASDFITLFISLRASWGSGIEHRVYVMTTVSIEFDFNLISSAPSNKKSIFIFISLAFFIAFLHN